MVRRGFLVFENPCMGEVALNGEGEPYTCNPMAPEGGCPKGHFCLAGDPAKKKSSYCCPRINQDPCNTFLSEGEGLDALNRFYYNPIDGDCFPFSYKGRKGNENNFLTKKMCQDMCKPISDVCFGGEIPLMDNQRIVQCHTQPCPPTHYCHVGADARSTVCCEKKGSPCDQQLMTGVGDHSLPRFYYDGVEDECVAFNYTGIAGNENNFATKAQCQIACPGYRGYCPHGKPHAVNGTMTSCGIDTLCPRDYLCHVSKRDSKSVCCPDPANFCLMPMDVGPCGKNITRYAYDREVGICKKFGFGSCRGNLNNFDSLEKCTEICCDKGYRAMTYML